MRRRDFKMGSKSVIRDPFIREDSLIFLQDKGLLIEGIDNDYSIKEGELEIHLHIGDKIISVING